MPNKHLLPLTKIYTPFTALVYFPKYKSYIWRFNR